MEQWTGRTLRAPERRKCEEIVTNYWLGPVLKYLDALFIKVEPDFNLFVAHMDGNTLNKCRCNSTLYRFEEKEGFDRWYAHYDRNYGQDMTTQDVKHIYELCTRYEYADFLKALNQASVKRMAYVRTILEESGHKVKILRVPYSAGPKKAVDVTEAAKRFAEKLEEKDIKESYEAK